MGSGQKTDWLVRHRPNNERSPVPRVHSPERRGTNDIRGPCVALKRMRQAVRRWRLNRQTHVTLAVVARLYNPVNYRLAQLTERERSNRDLVDLFLTLQEKTKPDLS